MGRNSIATRVKQGKFQVVYLLPKKGHEYDVIPVSEWLPIPPFQNGHIPNNAELVKGTIYESLFKEA